jgi:hypothetical protein
MHWQKELAYPITPKSGPMRRMETLLDANRALAQDLPRALFKKPYWLHVGKLLVLAAETGRPADIQEATENLLEVIDRQGWMHARRAVPVPLAVPSPELVPNSFPSANVSLNMPLETVMLGAPLKSMVDWMLS